MYRTLDKTISSLEVELATARAARSDGRDGSPAVAKSVAEQSKIRPRMFFVMGIMTAFSSRKRRDSIRGTWLPKGSQQEQTTSSFSIADVTKVLERFFLCSFFCRGWIEKIRDREGNHYAICHRSQVQFDIVFGFKHWLNIIVSYLILSVIPNSSSPGGVLDHTVEAEEEQHKDFFRLVNTLVHMLIFLCSFLFADEKLNLAEPHRRLSWIII